MSWSYADSPYFAWKYDEYFLDVQELLNSCSIDSFTKAQMEEELKLRLDIIESVMKTLDNEGVFSKNQNRNNVVILLQLMPSNEEEKTRSVHLNTQSNRMLSQWLINW